MCVILEECKSLKYQEGGTIKAGFYLLTYLIHIETNSKTFKVRWEKLGRFTSSELFLSMRTPSKKPLGLRGGVVKEFLLMEQSKRWYLVFVLRVMQPRN